MTATLSGNLGDSGVARVRTLEVAPGSASQRRAASEEGRRGLLRPVSQDSASGAVQAGVDVSASGEEEGRAGDRWSAGSGALRNAGL